MPSQRATYDSGSSLRATAIPSPNVSLLCIFHLLIREQLWKVKPLCLIICCSGFLLSGKSTEKNSLTIHHYRRFPLTSVTIPMVSFYVSTVMAINRLRSDSEVRLPVVESVVVYMIYDLVVRTTHYNS